MSKIPPKNESHQEETKPKTKGLLAKGIIVLLGVGMAGFGTDSFGIGGSSPDRALEVGDIVMTNQQVQNIKAAAKSQLPTLDDAKLQEITAFRAKAEVALANYMKQSGFSVSDDDFSERLKTLFTGADGQFERASLDSYLYRSGVTLDQLKAQIGQDALKQAVANSAIAVDEDVLPAMQMAQPTRNVSLIDIVPDEKFAEESASEEEVKAYFDEHTSDFDIPEKINVSYIDLDKSALKIDETVSEDALQTAFAEYQKTNTESEQRKSTYLLFGENQEIAEKVATALSSDELTWDDAQVQYKDEIEDAGEFDFASKANAESPEIGEALFAIAEKGQTSPAIKSEFGYLVLRLDDSTGSEVSTSLDDVRETLTQKVLDTRRDEKYGEELDVLEKAAFATGASFTNIKDALKITPKQTGLVEKTASESVLKLAQVQAALVDEAGKLKSVNSYIEPIEISDGRMVIVNIDEYEVAKPQTLEAVKVDVEKAATADKRSQLASDLAKTLETAIKSGKSLDELASEHGFSVKNFSDLSFQKLPQGDDLMLGIQLLQQPVVLGVENAQVFDTPTGGKAVAVTTKVTLDDAPNAEQLTSTTGAYAQQIGQKELSSMVDAIINATEFKVYDKSLLK